MEAFIQLDATNFRFIINGQVNFPQIIVNGQFLYESEAYNLVILKKWGLIWLRWKVLNYFSETI